MSMAAPPWGSLRPSGLTAACISALRRKPPGDIRRFLYRVMEWVGPYYDVELEDLKFRCRINDNATDTLLLVLGLPHFPELHRIVATLRPGDVFVDVGANTGLFSLHAAQAVGSTGTVVAIEPNPVMMERLRVNAILNEISNLHLVTCAVGPELDTATLHVVGRQQGTSSLEPVPKTTKTILVKVEPLLDIVRRCGLTRIDALKVDIEGFEDRALLPFFAGAPASLWPRYIMMEVNRKRWRQDVQALLVGLGYEVAWDNRRDVLLALRQ